MSTVRRGQLLVALLVLLPACAQALPNNWRNSAPSFSRLTGLPRKLFMPATRQRSRVSVKASAVSATMGSVAARRSGRAHCANSHCKHSRTFTAFRCATTSPAKRAG